MTTPATDMLRKQLGGFRPVAAVVLGSSVGAVAERMTVEATIPFADLPGFPRPSVSGHSGRVVAGLLGARPVVIVQGRAHPYETGQADIMRPVIQSLSELGLERIVLTNAAGSLNPGMPPGRIMLITDHVNLSGMNPLIGEKGDAGFVPMTDAYALHLLGTMRTAMADSGLPAHEGVYAWVSGPSFETPAEIRAMKLLGADAVGMSTVPETILARRFGLDVAGLSVITNYAAGLKGGAPSHDETRQQGARVVDRLAALLERFMELV